MATISCTNDKGHYVYGNSLFCPECGAPAEERRCPKCKQLLGEKQKFCERCGENVSNVTPTRVKGA